MFSTILKPFLRPLRCFNVTNARAIKVCVVGAAGGIGQPLSLFLKLDTHITLLHMHDMMKHMPGVAEDISHVNTPTKCVAFVGSDQLRTAVTGMDIIVIPAGVPRKPGMTRDDLFGSNASIVRDVTRVISKANPNAIIIITTNPINAVVPVACEVMNKVGKLNPNKILGVTTLDALRASTFYAKLKGLDPRTVRVPIIGGHAGLTIIPVFSKVEAASKLTMEETIALTKKVQEAGGEVVKLKVGMGSATLSMAYAGYRFVSAVMKGFRGESHQPECCYRLNKVEDMRYFATPCVFGKDGVEKDMGLPDLNDFEKEQLKIALPVLKKSYERGEKFVAS